MVSGILKTACFTGILFLFCSNGFCQNNSDFNIEKLDWVSDYAVAKQNSKESGIPILIFFTGSDWCGPCKMLVADFFESETFHKNVPKKFILYKADFPRNRTLVTKQQALDNNRLKGRYSVGTYPSLVVVNGKGKKMGLMKGYNLGRNTTYHYSFLEAVLKKHNKAN